MKAVFRLYVRAFSGLSLPAWVLSIVMLINRSGAMVIPFMTIYLTDSLGFSKTESGWILAFYGAGAMVGTSLGGYLTDKVGHYRVQTGSLIATGLFFFFLSTLETFWSLCIGVFLLSSIADTLRPANGASIGHYSKKENVTKSFSLNRLAINLGYSIGPAIGGVLAASSFKFLFYADGLTCILAGLFFAWFFRRYQKGEQERRVKNKLKGTKYKSAYRDPLFLWFSFLNFGFAVVFFQILYTLPLFYSEVYEMSKANVGLMLAVNGFLIFLTEMIIVDYFEGRSKVMRLVMVGVALTTISFTMLNWIHAEWWLYLSMILLSLGEIFAMPFAIAWVSLRSDENSRGSYMGVFTLSYATAHIFAPLIGTRLISELGYTGLWYVMGGIGLVVTVGQYLIYRRIQPLVKE